MRFIWMLITIVLLSSCKGRRVDYIFDKGKYGCYAIIYKGTDGKQCSEDMYRFDFGHDRIIILDCPIIYGSINPYYFEKSNDGTIRTMPDSNILFRHTNTLYSSNGSSRSINYETVFYGRSSDEGTSKDYFIFKNKVDSIIELKYFD